MLCVLGVRTFFTSLSHLFVCFVLLLDFKGNESVMFMIALTAG